MEEKKYFNNKIEEGFEYKQLSNGLNVYFIKKSGFKESVAFLTTKFGAKNISFKYDGKQYNTPLGIAHFLEHKLFACSDGIDVSNKFANLNLNCNACTSYKETTYYFSGTKNFEKGLELLLDFVQDPYFTDENVENEKGIIIQEIMMYKDMPKERVKEMIKQNLFVHSPLKYDIGGTVDDVNKITKEDLYLCHEIFYHPSNMVLVIASDCNPNDIFKLVEENQNKKEFKKPLKLETDEVYEPIEINSEYSETHMEISLPKVIIGFKYKYEELSSKESFFDRIYVNNILNYNFGYTSKFYESLLKRQLISSPLRYSYINEEGIKFISFTADTTNVNEFVKVIKNKLNQITKTKIPKIRVEFTKKRFIGNWIAFFNSVYDVASEFLDYYLDGLNLFDLYGLLEQINVEENNKKSAGLSNPTISVGVVLPNE